MATQVRPLEESDRQAHRGAGAEERGRHHHPRHGQGEAAGRKVMAVGPGKTEDGKVLTLDVKAGDRVLFGKYAGTEIKLDGEEHLILREEDILGVIER